MKFNELIYFLNTQKLQGILASERRPCENNYITIPNESSIKELFFATFEKAICIFFLIINIFYNPSNLHTHKTTAIKIYNTI